MIEKARYLIEFYGFRAAEAHCALEARPPVQWNKGRASIYILRTAFGVDWGERIKIIYAGDDVTDEDAMMVSKVQLKINPDTNIFTFSLSKVLQQHSVLHRHTSLKHRLNVDFRPRIPF